MTGATGLVGASLVRLLSFLNEEQGAGCKIVAMARDEKRARRVLAGLPVDLLVQDAREELRYSGKLDCIIDCASNNHPLLFAKEPVETIQANARGIENLLEHARKAGGGAKVLFASSVEVYGNTERLGLAALKEGDFGSTDCNTVRACYTESKRLAETLCRSYFDEYGVPAYIARLGKTYGPFFAESDTKVMSYMLKCAARGENIVLKSRAEQRLSFCYSIDAAAAFLSILFCGSPGEAYNVASKNSVFTLREVAERIAAFANVAIESSEPAEAERKGFTVIGDAVQNTDKLEGLGWQPKIGMDDGLRHSIEYNKAKS